MTIRARAAGALLVAATALLAACEKEGPQELVTVAPQSAIKFFNFAVGGPGVNFYAGDVKLTAINATACTPLPAPPADSTCRRAGLESTTGTAAGAAGNGGLYLGLAPGQYTFTGRIAAATDKGLAVASSQQTLQAGKYYSLFMSGPYSTTAKQSEAFVIEDPLPTTVAGDTTYIRFVNASANAPAVRLSFVNSAGGLVPITSAPVAYKSGSPFVAFPGSGVVDVSVINATTGAVIFTRTGVSFNAGRAYTVTLRGDWTVSPTGTSANRPQLDNTANY